MLVLALDTTTRLGSAAIVQDGTLVDCESGDVAETHGQRLPGDLARLLARRGFGVRDVDLYAVAAGPGSFTGLRVGIATMQGLALANGRSLAGVSALDALNASAHGAHELTAAWMDAQRGQVFAALYRGATIVDGPLVDSPENVLSRWQAMESGLGSTPILFAGDGALRYADLVRQRVPGAVVLPAVPPLAPAIALLAVEPLPPDAIRPIYVRRPDAELARDRLASSKAG